MDLAPEIEIHPRHTGRPLVDLVLGISAIMISLMSMVLAVMHGNSMEKMVEQNARMVQANTWPYVTVGDANTDAAGVPLYKVVLINNGVGPAKIDRLSLTYRGRKVRDFFALAHSLARDSNIQEVRIATSDSGGVLPARQTVSLLTVQKPYSSTALINAFGKYRSLIGVEVCYCSLFEECWSVDNANDQRPPRKVADCAESQYK